MGNRSRAAERGMGRAALILIVAVVGVLVVSGLIVVALGKLF